jgi:hypothetical protein
MEETRVEKSSAAPAAQPGEPFTALAVALDGTVCAATPLGTVIVELAGAAFGRPEVVTSVQNGIASGPVELARYPVRSLLALVLHAMRTRRKRHRNTLPITVRVPLQLRRAQRLAMAQFVRINFDTLMLMAHAVGMARATRFRRWPAPWPAFPIRAA